MLDLTFQAASERFDRAHNERMALAWHVAYLNRKQKLPQLKTLLAKPRAKPRQSLQEQMRVMDLWVAATNRPKKA